MYRDMVTLSVMDKILYESQRQGRISFYMSNTGEEAVQIGSAAALTLEDKIYAQYREAGMKLHCSSVVLHLHLKYRIPMYRRVTTPRVSIREVHESMLWQLRGWRQRKTDAGTLWLQRVQFHNCIVSVNDSTSTRYWQVKQLTDANNCHFIYYCDHVFWRKDLYSCSCRSCLRL